MGRLLTYRFSWGPKNKADCWLVFYVNGYKFHTTKWGRGKEKTTMWFVLKEMSAMVNMSSMECLRKYLSWSTLLNLWKRVMLFNCEWYNLRHLGRTCKHNHYKIIKISYTKRYGSFHLLIISQNVKQVHYLSCFGKCKSN